MRTKLKVFLLASIVMIFGVGFTGCADKVSEPDNETVVTQESDIPEQEVEFEE